MDGIDRVVLLGDLTLEVTQQDIFCGSRCSSSYCPIALALARKLEGYGYECLSVGNGGGCIEWMDENGLVAGYALYHFDEAGINFVRKFDTRAAVEPTMVLLKLHLPVGRSNEQLRKSS